MILTPVQPRIPDSTKVEIRCILESSDFVGKSVESVIKESSGFQTPATSCFESQFAIPTAHSTAVLQSKHTEVNLNRWPLNLFSAFSPVTLL